MAGPEGAGRAVPFPTAAEFNVEELRRRNPDAIVMDILYLFTTGFFAILAVKGFWPAVIAGIPLGLMLYFGLRSSIAFFIAQLLAMGLALAAEWAGYVPL